MSATSTKTPALDDADLSVLREMVRAAQMQSLPVLTVRTGLPRSRVEAALELLDGANIAASLGRGRARSYLATAAHPVSVAARILFAPGGQGPGGVLRAYRAAMEVRGKRRTVDVLRDVFRVARFAWLAPKPGAVR